MKEGKGEGRDVGRKGEKGERREKRRKEESENFIGRGKDKIKCVRNALIFFSQNGGEDMQIYNTMGVCGRVWAWVWALQEPSQETQDGQTRGKRGVKSKQ